MANDPQDNAARLSEKELAFFGRISASVSHEINNVLTGINEMSGLLYDLSSVSSPDRPLASEKVVKNSDAIMRRTQRGVAVVKRFNRFAHSADEPESVFDPAEHIENLATLCERLAMIKNIRIEYQGPEDNIKLKGSPFRMQHAVFACVDAGLNALENGGCITVAVKRENAGAAIAVSMSPVADEGPIQILKDEIPALAAAAGAETLFSTQAAAAAVTLQFKG